MEVDITGLMVESLPNWEEEAREWCKAENFNVDIAPTPDLWDHLNESQRGRLAKKLKLVEEWAGYMAAGMLKGTIKYHTDDYELKNWMAHLIGEGADQANYQILLADSWRKNAG